MVQATFLENLKRLRLAKGFTQEQVADRLKVNMQTVSRWECGTSLPDVLTLPALARLYGVTVDDFYKKSSAAYENYAQRLAAVYEKTRDPEDFIRCLAEFRKCINEGKLTIADKWNYAIIHQFMFQYCKETAIAWYDPLVNDDPSEDPHAYWRARSCRVSMYCAAGRCDEILIEQKERVLTDPDDVRESDLLIQAYIFADRYDEAYEFFHEAAEKFPDDWQIYIHGGDICKKMKKYGDALKYYDRAGEIGTYFCDDLYCKASLYEDMGDYEKACNTYVQIADTLRQRGFDVEAEMAKDSAKKAMEHHSVL